MLNAMRSVREFMIKNKLTVDKRLKDYDDDLCTGVLRSVANIVKSHAKDLESEKEDQRLMRAHLILEEAGEFMEAMADGDELKAFDGLVDLLYVVIGSGVTFSLPLPEGFEEVHRSNMTKERQVSDVAGHRIRDKGPNYSAPNLQAILAWLDKE